MRVLVIGGFLGSGKTTMVLGLGKYLGERGYKVAIVVNEIGEVGVDGDVISKYGFNTKEITNGCICCSLKMDMKYTISNLHREYDPDVILIEPTGIAFPNMIKAEVEKLDLPDLTFAPLVTLIDGSRFKYLIKEMKHFSRRQIEDAEILVINKADLVKPLELPIIEESVKQLNPKATVFKLSAKKDDDAFRNFMDTVLSDPTFCIDVADRPTLEEVDSIACSGVASYASEFMIQGEINSESASSLAEDIIESVKTSVLKLNPEFLGHIKLFLEHSSGIVKASITAYYESPQIENIESDMNKEAKLKILSAVSNISKDELVKIVNECVEDNFLKHGIKGQNIIEKPALWNPAS
ncbi:GTP-binding protein [Methanolobus sp. ZRKC3]|uniref:GTP-binding protein n=1 Tax=Methanolobus sp. ZRKC3 TaxID=3125786 RepID=UPI003244411B